MNILQIVLSLIDGRSICISFRILLIILQQTLTYESLCGDLFLFHFFLCEWVKFLGQMVSVYLHLQEMAKLFSKVFVSFCIFTCNIWEFYQFYILYDSCFLRFLRCSLLCYKLHFAEEKLNTFLISNRLCVSLSFFSLFQFSENLWCRALRRLSSPCTKFLEQTFKLESHALLFLAIFSSYLFSNVFPLYFSLNSPFKTFIV